MGFQAGVWIRILGKQVVLMTLSGTAGLGRSEIGRFEIAFWGKWEIASRWAGSVLKNAVASLLEELINDLLRRMN